MEDWNKIVVDMNEILRKSVVKKMFINADSGKIYPKIYLQVYKYLC